MAGEDLFFELAIEDLRQAADLFRPVYDRTGGADEVDLRTRHLRFDIGLLANCLSRRPSGWRPIFR